MGASLITKLQGYPDEWRTVFSGAGYAADYYWMYAAAHRRSSARP